MDNHSRPKLYEVNELKNIDKLRLCGEMEVPPSAKLLYLMLVELSGPKGKVMVPHRQLAATVGLSRSTVSLSLRRLQQSGYIKIRTKYSIYGGRLPNLYILPAGRWKR